MVIPENPDMQKACHKWRDIILSCFEKCSEIIYRFLYRYTTVSVGGSINCYTCALHYSDLINIHVKTTLLIDFSLLRNLSENFIFHY